MKIINNIHDIEELLELKVNMDVEDRVPYFSTNLWKYLETVLFVSQESKILGYLAYSEKEEGVFLLEVVGVDEHSRGLGISSELLDFFIELAKDGNKAIRVNRFTGDGMKRLKDQLFKLSEKKNISIEYLR